MRLYYIDGDVSFYTSMRALRNHFNDFFTQKERESFLGFCICSVVPSPKNHTLTVHGFVGMNRKNRLVVKRSEK